MRMLVIARWVWESDEYDTIGIPELAATRGHDVDVMPAATALQNVPQIVSRVPDVVICRFASDPEAIAASCRLIDAGVIVLGGGPGITTGDDHVLGLQALEAAGVPVPDFLVVGNAHDAERAADELGLPAVTKDPHTMAGVGVRLAASTDDICTHLASLHAGMPLLVERFYGECRGEHIRLFVVADEVVDAVRFVAKPGEFRANAWQGGRPHEYSPTPVERQVAVAAAVAIGVDIVGVDILATATGPRVLEANPNPAPVGIDGAAEAIVDYAEWRVEQEAERT
jgi:ribosomal protein S6--L-glutamate ligase